MFATLAASTTPIELKMATEPTQSEDQQRRMPTREELRAATLGDLADVIADQIKGSSLPADQRALSLAYALCVELITDSNHQRITGLQEEVEALATKMLSPESDSIRALLTEAIRRGYEHEPKLPQSPPDKAAASADNVPMADSVNRPELDAKLEALRHEMRADAAVLRSNFAAADASISKTAATMAISVSELKGHIEKALAESRADTHKMDASIKTWMIATVIGLFLGFGGLFFAMSNAQKPAQNALSANQPSPIIIQVPAYPAIETPAKTASAP